MTCPACALRAENDRLLAKRQAANAASGHCFIAEDPDATRVTIYPKMSKDQNRRLLDLLLEIEQTHKEED